MKWSSFSNSPYLSASDFEDDEEKTVVIKDIQSELVGRARESKPVAYFYGSTAKPLILNVTNRRKIQAACGGGDDIAQCIGAQLVLYVVEVEFSGESTLGVRVREVLPPGRRDGPPPAPKPPPADFAPNARARAKAKKPLADEMEDDIPF